MRKIGTLMTVTARVMVMMICLIKVISLVRT